MEEQRHHPRTRVLRRARIIFRRGFATLDCVVLDLSAGGARLNLGALARVPELFEIRIENGPKRAARLCYRSGEAAGIRFDPV